MKTVLLLAFLFCVSCSASKKTPEEFYFSCESDYGYDVYPSSKCTGETMMFIPSQTTFYTKTPEKKKNIYVTYGSTSGWISKPKLKRANRTVYKLLPQSIVTEQDSLLAEYNKRKSYTPQSHGPTYNSKATHTTSGVKTIQVRGYYRKNGTYVRPHMRSTSGRRH